MSSRRPGVARAMISAFAASLGVLLLTACQPGAPTEDPDPDVDTAALRVRTVHSAESLDTAARREVEEAVGDVLSGYVVAAFLGPFPREEFVRAFESFTSGAARSAARDIEQLTAARVQDATAVRATQLDARLSVLSHDRSVVGATALVDLAFEATMPDGTVRPVTLTGRFLLEDDDGTWSVFGYDVTMDDGAVVEAESAS